MTTKPICYKKLGQPCFCPDCEGENVTDSFRALLSTARRTRLDLMVHENRTDKAIFTWLVRDGLSRHDAHLLLDHYVYGEPITCKPLE